MKDKAMRMVLSGSALFVALALCCAPAFAGDSDEGDAMQQLDNATSGHQTLQQTYGDLSPSETCPSACPDGGTTNIPEPPPPTPADTGNDNPN